MPQDCLEVSCRKPPWRCNGADQRVNLIPVQSSRDAMKKFVAGLLAAMI
jgi:hypothetical protein